MPQSKERELKSVGFILRLIPAQEADVVVRILTATGEKISAFAKAGLKSRKRFGGSLQPLLHIDFRATRRPHSEMHYLEETIVRQDFQNLKNQIEVFAGASYLAELTDQCAHEGLENIEIYNLFGAGLRALEAGLPLDGVLRQFEVKLMALMGWLPAFDTMAGVSVADDTRILLERLLSTSILKNDFKESESRKVESFTKPMLQAHWGDHKLKSVQFLSSLRRFQK
jgi:DNA repair protein RecO